MQVSLGLLVKSDVVVQASNRGAEIDQAAQEDLPRRDGLAGEGQLADEGEEGALGACTCVSEGAERVEKFVFSLKCNGAMESSWIPRKVRVVDGSSVFSCFRGALMRVQSSAMSCMLWLHVSESGGPAVKKSSK